MFFAIPMPVSLACCGRALSAVSFGERVQLLAGFEADGFARRDADFGAGAGVAADAGFAGAYAEDAKSAQFDALTGRQSFFQAFEDCIHRSFGFGAGQSCALDYVMNDVLLDQSGYLAGATTEFPGNPCRFSFRSRSPHHAGCVDLRGLVSNASAPVVLGEDCTTPYTVDGTAFASFLERRTTARMRKNPLPLHGLPVGVTFWSLLLPCPVVLIERVS
jgi:hypothetical protein